MEVGNRVWHVIDANLRTRQWVGTVERVSPAGYIRVRWDYLDTVEHFPPFTRQIRVVTGDDALPRHDWDTNQPITVVDPPCLNCGVIQNDENEFAACKGKST